MLQIECNGDAIRVLHNDKLVIAHDRTTPFVSVGEGSYKFRSFSDGWQMKGLVKHKSELPYGHYDKARKTLRFHNGDFSVTFSMEETEDGVLLRVQRASNKINRYWFTFPCRSGTAVYGGGAQYRSMNLRGRKIKLWQREERFSRGVLPEIDLSGDREPSGFPQATFLTDDNTYVHVDHAGYAALDFTATHRMTVETWDAPKGLLVGGVETPQQAVKHLSHALGRQPLLPQWAYDGAWMDIGGGLQSMLTQLEKAVGAKAVINTLCIRDWTGLREDTDRQVPFYDWVWNQEMYPRLPEMIHQFTVQGIRTMAYINPHFSIEGRLFSEASLKGYLLRKTEGGVAIHDMGGFMAGHLDLTNPEAVKWFKHIIKANILDMGFSGYIADLSGFLPPHVVLHSRQDPVEVHNQWPLLWAKLNREAVREAGRGQDVVFYTHAGTGGVSRESMLVETGEHSISWSRHDGLPSALTGALSLGYSGVGVSHAPIGGTHSLMSTRSKELMIRWCEYAAFTPVMRFTRIEGKHWEFGSDVETGELLARLTRVHQHIAPYMRSLLRESAAYGLPVMRSLQFCYPDEKKLLKNKDAYMLGSELFVAPVMQTKTTKRKLFLPQGNWVHVWTGQEYVGGETEVRTPLGQPPVFANANGDYMRVFSGLSHID